jgi:filamentous hemagglutinin family protein
MKPIFHKSRRTLGSYLSLGSAVIISSLIYSRAGDILRGGGGSSSLPAAAGSGSGTGITTPADTAQARINAQDALARTSNALNAVRAMQDAARATAISGPNNLSPGLPDVSNGIGTNGLQVAPGVGTDPSKWQGADLPTETTDLQGLVNVGIRQTAQQALLQWQTFNVGKNTTVTFDQTAGGANSNQWIAFNQITDPTGNPSQILGQIKAQGQVYVINPNGIIFGGSSTVDVNTLTVSSLPINNNLIARGLLNNPDSQFLFSGLSLLAGPNGTAAFTPTPPPVSTGVYGDVTVQAGAKITTPVSADGNGGRVALFGANVKNEGTILTPAGQTILAAGLQIGLTAHDSLDPSLRGLDVFVGQVGTYGGTIDNTGFISSPRGSITLAGKNILLTGALTSSTSVSLNGRIELLAHYGAQSNPSSANSLGSLPFLNRNSGSVTLGNNSVIEILPEYSSKETTIGSVLSLRSQINLEGLAVYLGENSTILAPNALVRLAAGEWNFLGGITPTSKFTQSAGQVYLDKDALVNVAGSIDVPVSVAQNIISVDLRAAELANSPLQRNGPLRSQSVQIDVRDAGIYEGTMWLGTPLADVAGFANLIQRGIGQLTTAGGSVTISAGASTVMQAGSKIDVSGGSIAYQEAIVRTSQLITPSGSLVDISQARPDVVYLGIYDAIFDASNVKFGVTELYSGNIVPGGGRLENGYLQGAAGGSLSIRSASAALDGSLLGKIFAGESQRASLPSASSLILDFSAIDRSFPSLPTYAPTPPAIVFQSQNPLSPADPFQTDADGKPLALRGDLLANVFLSPEILTSGGFGNFTLNNPDGSITVPDGITIRALERGTISMSASNINVDGSIISPGGTISFFAPNLTLSQINTLASTSVSVTPLANPGRGIFRLGQTGNIDTSGLPIDDRLANPSSGSLPLALSGGSVTIRAFQTILDTGGKIDVSGGARADSRARISYGNAGNISLSGGRDLAESSILGGSLQLGATLAGYSGTGGGSLSLTASAFQIGGTNSDNQVTVLSPSFFTEGGFSSFSLSGTGIATSNANIFIPGILITANTTIRPIVQSRLAIAANDQPLTWQNPVILQEGIRPTSSLSFSATGATSRFTSGILARGEILMDSGSYIETDAKGTVTMTGQTTTVLGSVKTPGGSISITGASSFPSPSDPPLFTTVLIGASSILDVSGKTLLLPDSLGLRTGQVLAGGSISVSGNILTQDGARLIANGTSGILDLTPAASSLYPAALTSLNGLITLPVTIESNGGTITLTGQSFLHNAASLTARSGGASAIGGTLNISSSRFVPPNTTSTSADINLIVTQNGPILSSSNPETTGITPLDENGIPVSGLGRITVDSFGQGGFHSLRLGGNVRFQGNVSISIPGTIRLATGGIIETTGTLNLSAPHIYAGQNFLPPSLPGEIIEYFTSNIPGVGNQPLSIMPSTGSGNIALNAKLIDLGTLSLQGIGNAAFNVPTGEIRGNGTLQAAANLVFNAGQIHPTTSSIFNIFAYGNSNISIIGGSARPLPFSVGGTLNLHASAITQNGTLRAPLGNINLGWNGSGTSPQNPVSGNLLATPVTSNLTLGPNSVTSTSAIDPITGKPAILPYGISFDGNSWIDPSGIDITTTGPSNKDIKLSSQNLATEAGSLIDISGGGDLFAYRFVSGNGGRNDLLASESVFAIIPSYNFEYAPYAPFNQQAEALQGAPGYSNSTLKAGDQITLAAGSNLPTGTYTLLPARYALLPGAFLVTPRTGNPANPSTKADRSSIVSGYRANNLDPNRSGPTSIGSFEVASANTFRQRAEYQEFTANKFFTDVATSREVPVPRLPMDAGILSYTASTNFSIAGAVAATTPASARGALIDINSPVDILINTTGTGGAPGILALSSSLLNSFGADSLLIGGVRTQSQGRITVSTSTENLTLDNEGVPLIGNDIILTASDNLILGENSAITASGNRPIGSITLGSEATPGSGNGSLVRVSSSAQNTVNRLGVTPGGTANLITGNASSLSGTSLILDSTAATSLDPGTILLGSTITLSSGELSIALENPGTIAPTTGLILAGNALSTLLTNTSALTLRSYSNLNLYGTGQIGSSTFQNLTLQAANLRGLNQNNGSVILAARNLTLGNPSAPQTIAPAIPNDGTLTFASQNLNLSGGNTAIYGFATTNLNATDRILTSSEGSLVTSSNLNLDTPILTGLQASKYAISSTGSFSYTSQSAPSVYPGGLGANLSLTGSSVSLAGNIHLASGQLTVTSVTGDLLISGSLDLSGTSRQFVDVSRHTSGGSITLKSDNASVRILQSAVLNLSAPAAAGNAGQLNVFSPNGSLEILGTVNASPGANGNNGSFTLDTSSIASLAALDEILNTGSFTKLRDYRIRTGNVVIDSNAIASTYRLAADQGDITLSGNINASGNRGGSIDLKANGSLTLLSGSSLDASAEVFDAAGKGGSVNLEAGSQRNGIVRSDALLTLSSGSSISLGVAENNASSASLGKFTGTLQLRAPRNVANTDLQLAAIGSNITGASSITVEGYKLYDLTGTASGTITSTIQTQIRNDANAYLGASGSTTSGYSAILTRLTGLNSSLDLILTPGAEIINRTGDLTLGTISSNATLDWNLATFRFGPKSAAGTLTLRASQNLTFYNALSDGFSGGASLWLSPLIANNPLLPASSQSWSYHLAAGADTSAASFRSVLPLDSISAGQGNLQLGKNAGAATATGGANAVTSSIIGNSYQVIRTGSGDIDISTARSIQLLNPFASIYTAGTSVADPTAVFAPGDFVTPILNRTVPQTNLGAAQQNYSAYYSMAGGNVTLSAGLDIERLTRNNSGLIADSSRQLPNNWLYRRAYVAPNGQFGSIRIGSGLTSRVDAAASTTWWVDYSNFFQSVGALGGGNIILAAGNDVRNTDAAIPTNARAPQGAASAALLQELGGGDLSVRAGRDISGGVFYVERGTGSLHAAAAITTNGTRSPSSGLVSGLNNPSSQILDPLTWLPTTLFLGKSSFDLQAAGDILLGPATNPFLLPQGTGNRFWYKTHFSTYSADASVNALSLGGDVTLRNAVTLPGQSQANSLLGVWHQTQLLYTGSASSTSFIQPWLRLAENDLSPFSSVWELAPPSVSLTSFSGDLNMVGNLTTFPSPVGQLELIAAGSVAALQPSGISNTLINGQATRTWTSSSINLSDADPRSIPSPLSPLNTGTANPTGAIFSASTTRDFMFSLAALLTESGSYIGNDALLQTRQSRHTSGGLHSVGADPVRIHAIGGDISGLTLFSAKPAWITAGRDITDIAFYLQNTDASHLSIVSAARDIIAANPFSLLRNATNALGNALSFGQSPLPGDIQIAGPGNLHVLAGRNLDLGTGSALANGTGGGISSIGNFRNPYLISQGAGITALAGIGPATNLASSMLATQAYIQDVASTEEGMKLIEKLLPGTDINTLSTNEIASLAIELFFRTLRDAGRDFNNPESTDFGTYKKGFAAIELLLGENPEPWNGEIIARSRDIRTRSGGDIRLLAPGGGLTLANTALGNPLTPPGVITESGGSISIFADQSVDIGIGRIFTLRGGEAIIWSTKGDIAAGSSSRTVLAAPPTRVVIDPQAASVQTDLAGLATGGGIGVLATVAGIEPGDVDLIAPAGIIDAGDAGIRVSGNINLAAVQVVNAGNISAGGTSIGGNATVSAPSVATVTTASNSAAATSATAANTQNEARKEISEEVTTQLSVFDVVVIGYGGGEAPDEEKEEEESEDSSQNTEDSN